MRADLRRIERALQLRDERWQAEDAAGFAQADATFHLAVVAAAHNEVITATYADLYAAVRDRIRDELGPRTRAGKYVDHDRLVDAIRDKDPERASAEAAAHPHSWTERG